MICKKCQKIIALQAFSYGECKLCGSRVATPHIPCYIICKKCSEKLSLCQQCGELMEIKDEN